MNYKMQNKKVSPTKDIQEIEDLISAYEFAQNNKLTEKNFLQIHKILSRLLLIESKQGIYRTEKVGIFSTEGLVYLAIEPENVAEAMKNFSKRLEN